MGRILDALEHRVRLPPGDVVVIVKVGQPVGGMGQVVNAGVANVARLLRSFGARLRAELARSVQATSVGGFHSSVESRVHEVWNASLLIYDKDIVFRHVFLFRFCFFVLFYPFPSQSKKNSNKKRDGGVFFIIIESESRCPGMDIQSPCGKRPDTESDRNTTATLFNKRKNLNLAKCDDFPLPEMAVKR